MSELFEFIRTVGGGVSGALLAFYMWKLAPELRAIWRALDRMNTVRILGIISSTHVAPELKDEAASILKTVEEEETKGKKRETIPP